MKKWSVLAAGVLCQTSIGGIYAWSTFVPYLMDTYSFSRAQCGMIFGVMVATFTLATIPAGRVLLKIGPRITAAVGALLFAAGYLIASLSGGGYGLLLAGLGVVAGTGIGFVYVCPLSVGMKWFPEHKGLVTGVAVAGFGLGAVFLSAAAERLLLTHDILATLRIIGGVLGAIALFSALFLSLPPVDSAHPAIAVDSRPVLPLLLSRPFLLICVGMFAGTFAGLLISGNLKPLKMNMGLSSGHATLTISLFAIGNTLGRLFWGQVHDRLGSRKTMLLSLAFLCAAIVPLLFVTGTSLIFTVSVLIGFGFGACFVVYASAVVEAFGVESLAQLYPVCFAGYGCAALIGPAIGGWIADTTGSYASALVLCCALVLAALISIRIWFPERLVQAVFSAGENAAPLPAIAESGSE